MPRSLLMRIGFLLLMCLWIQNSIYAQNKTVLKGKITVTDGPSYPYTLELEGSGSSLKGISITDQDGTPVRMKVNATAKKDMHALIVTENATMGMIPDSMEGCYVNAVLKWKVKKGKAHFSGFFAGKNKKGDICYSGMLEMDAPAADCPFIEKEAPKKIVKDSVKVEVVKQVDSLKITEGIDKIIQWEGTVCTLEVWDGGVIDGDAVTILHNGKEVVSNYALTAEKRQIVTRLSGGDNVFTIVAADEGSAPPTTVDIVVHDGSKHYRLTAFNKKGKQAKIILKR